MTTPFLTDGQRRVLRALVDTAVPALDPPEGDDDPHGYWSRSGSSLDVHTEIELFLADKPAADRDGAALLLEVLAALGFPDQGRATREGILATVAALNADTAKGVANLRAMACTLAHSVTDTGGRNPLWARYGYPGPQRAAPEGPDPITPYVPEDGAVLEADTVVIGSGAGGGTIAGILATAGHDVVVLEAGGATGPGDLHQLELPAGRTTMYGGGIVGTVEGNAGLLAGRTLGGGTTVNWQNCVRPSDFVRREWAREHGLDGLDTDAFDHHLDAVLTRMGANDRCSDLNGPHQRMAAGARALGWSVHTAVRNADPDSYDPATAGYTQFGDPSRSKRGTLATYLLDAHTRGARILTHTEARRIIVRDGRAAGVTATRTDPATGQTRQVSVHAANVVVAGGALETPAVLLRSGIGGPAVGEHLYLHPSAGVFGVYDAPQDPWWGPPQAAVMDEFAHLDDGYGLLVEGGHFSPGVIAWQLARRDGAESKAIMGRLRETANLLFIMREHSGGRVVLDAEGRAEHHYALTDPRDVATYHEGLRVLTELHLAAGAEELWLTNAPVLRRGQDPKAWLDSLRTLPIGLGGLPIGTAHQMGGARMGTDPATSVARPTGELHDTSGVWIGDTSAFPTPSGANPMLTCMALAHRTAQHILA